MKEEFLMLLRSVNREGMDELINFIEKSDFFKAPASTRFHGSYEGGLLEHSLNVLKKVHVLARNAQKNIGKGNRKPIQQESRI